MSQDNDGKLLAGSGIVFPFPEKLSPDKSIVDDETLKDIKAKLKENWTSMQKVLDKVEVDSTQNYQLIIAINIAIVAAGIVLLSFSIFYSLPGGNSLFGAIMSGIAVADFVVVFLFNPQTRVRKVLGDKVQMQIIYRTWKNQAVAAYVNLVRENYSSEDIDKFQNDLKNYGKD